MLKQGVAIVVVIDECVLLTYNFKRKGNEFFGGKIEDDEKIYDACVRELFEETGITVKATDFVYLGKTNEPVEWITYFCKVSVPNTTVILNKEPKKHRDWFLQPIKELNKLHEPSTAIKPCLEQIHGWLNEK